MPKLDLSKLRQLSRAASSGPYSTHFNGSTHTIAGVVDGENGRTPVAGDIAEWSDAELIEHLLTHREQIIDTLIVAACLAGTLRGKLDDGVELSESVRADLEAYERVAPA